MDHKFNRVAVGKATKTPTICKTDASIRNYDDVDFDWNMDDFAETELSKPEVSEYLLAHRVVPEPPRQYVKPSWVDEKEQSREKYTVEFQMSGKTFEKMKEDWGMYVLEYKPLKFHDHPVSHIATELNERSVIRSLKGKRFINLWGNSARALKAGGNCVTVYDLATPKDYLRYQQVPAGCVKGSLDQICAGLIPEVNGINTMVLTHSLYYANVDLLADWLNQDKSRQVYAVVHRHGKAHGFLNCGEQEYWVDPQGTVSQKNLLTGQGYTHKTLEPWFHQDSCSTAFGGLAWDISLLGGDTFMIKIVACPETMTAGPLVDVAKCIEQQATFDSRYNVVLKEWLGFQWVAYSPGGRSTAIPLTDPELFDKLRRFIAGRERTSRYKTELFNLGKRLTNSLDLISLHSGVTHKINLDHLSEYVNAACYCDVEREFSSAVSYYKDRKNVVECLNEFYSTGCLPTDVTKLQDALQVCSAATDLVTTGLKSLAEAPFRILDAAIQKGVTDFSRMRAAAPDSPCFTLLGRAGGAQPSAWLDEKTKRSRDDSILAAHHALRAELSDG